jgi:hypothetical protein
MAIRNYIIALVMGLLALVQTVSGFVLWLALPSSGRGAAGGTFLWSRGVWLNIHSRSAIVLMVIVVIHVILHWGWIVSMTKSCFGRK